MDGAENVLLGVESEYVVDKLKEKLKESIDLIILLYLSRNSLSPFMTRPRSITSTATILDREF